MPVLTMVLLPGVVLSAGVAISNQKNLVLHRNLMSRKHLLWYAAVLLVLHCLNHSVAFDEQRHPKTSLMCHPFSSTTPYPRAWSSLFHAFPFDLTEDTQLQLHTKPYERLRIISANDITRLRIICLSEASTEQKRFSDRSQSIWVMMESQSSN